MAVSKLDAYLVRSLVRASEILLAFGDRGESLRLRDVMHRTRLSKGVCFRLLYTLRHCGLVDKVETRYRLTGQIGGRKLAGYDTGEHNSFAGEVPLGPAPAAAGEHLGLIIVPSKYQPKVALRNAELLIPTAWTSSSNSKPTKRWRRRLRRSPRNQAHR